MTDEDKGFFEQMQTCRAAYRRLGEVIHETVGRQVSAFDLGCGVGDATLRLKELGWGVKGMEFSEDARALADPSLEMLPLDLTAEPLDVEQADCVICTETAEHVEVQYADTVVDNITARARKAIVFSAARLGQEWPGHVNCQMLEYWVEKFKRRGWVLSKGKSAMLQRLMLERNAQHSGAAGNFVVFHKRTTPELVVVSTSFALPEPMELMCKLSVSGQTLQAKHIFIDASLQDPPKTHTENLYDTVKSLDPDTVVVQLDGDDWLAHGEVLERLSKLYEDPELWLTYGGFVTDKGQELGSNRAYGPTEQVRGAPWHCGHLKSFRAGLMQCIDPEDLKLEDGTFTSEGVDRAITYPMVERAGWDRTHWVDEKWYVFNWSASTELTNPERAAAGDAVTKYFEAKPRYARVEDYKSPPQERYFFKPASRRTDLVSVIVPCHKQSQYLYECLDSIESQTYERVEVIVACGDDESYRAAKSWRLKLALGPYKVLGGLVKGLADARNHAIEEATGRYVVCVDADDTVEPTFIAKLLEASPEGEQYSLVTCSMNEFGDRTGKRAIGLAGRDKSAELDANYFLVCSMFTRALHKLVGGYENSLFGYEDWDFWLKLCQVPTIYLGEVPEYLFNYRIHGDQGSNFCEQNDGALRAAIHLIHPDIYGPPTTSDMMTLAKCSEAARQKFLQRTAWFPDNRNAQLIGKLLADKIRDVFVPKGATP